MDLPFYHGCISKQAAEHLLMKQGRNGSYLVRDSESMTGALCLCILFGRLIYTYRIFQTSKGYKIQTAFGVKENVFKDIKDLISNYEKPNRGLVHCLLHPVNVERISLGSLKQRGSMRSFEEVEDTYAEVDDRDYVEVLPS
ncbi:SH2 domain-containing protein 1B-like [Pelobates fuscus]|uniref:SH2 domain-containing protein 1B-like n=1 Tax=Pelobates fuscus TaxID=191477 RepID=UPI002FE45DF6